MQRLLRPSCILALLMFPPILIAQKGQGKAGSAKTPAQAAPKVQPVPAVKPDAKADAAANGVAKAVLQAPDDRADYVPCKFTYNELQSLVTPERAERLTPADAEKLVATVLGELEKQEDANQLNPLVVQTMIGDLKWGELAGLTPTGAVSKVTAILSKARSLAALVASVTAVEDNRTEATKQAVTGFDTKETLDERTKALQEIDNLSLTAGISNAQAIEAAKDPRLVSTDTANLLERSQMALDFIKKAQKDVNLALHNNERNDFLYRFYRDYPGKQADKGSPASSAQASERATIATASIIGRTQQAVNLLVRPDDIGCAMSILSYDETKHAYGRLIANEYITVQVVVRNLSREQQFVLHDVEFATNVDPSGRIGRFYSGRDRIVVRALSQTQQLFDLRNLFVGGAELTSSIMASASLVYGGALSDASKVMASAFVPGFGKLWADISKDQSNLLNDTGFTSRTNSQIVVPTVGSTMFVTFIPQKQFEQGWWARKCASELFFPDIAELNKRELQPLTGTSGLAGDANVAATGIDVQHALTACRLSTQKLHRWQTVPQFSDEARRPDAGANGFSPGGKGSDPEAKTSYVEGNGSDPKKSIDFEAELFRSGQFVRAEVSHFRRWSGNAIALFQELSTVVVAGIHITDDKLLQPIVTDFHCEAVDKDTSILNWPASATAKITCTLTGKNLVKVKSLRAQNADDPVDPSAATGTLAMDGGDNTSARVTFDGDALHRLKGTNYVLILTDSIGAEQKTSFMLHLPTGAYVSKVTPDTLDMSSSLPDSVELDGYHLKDVQKLVLSDAAGPVSLVLASIPVSDDSKRYFKTDGATWDKLGKSAATVTLQLLDGAGVEVKSNTKTVSFTPKPAAIAAQNTKKDTKPVTKTK